MAQLLPVIKQTRIMKKILIGALVCAAVAGVVYYLAEPERFTDTVDDLKRKADDAIMKAKDGLAKAEESIKNQFA